MVPNWLKRFFRKSSNPYPKSFGKRLTWRIMLVLFVVMGIPAVIVWLAWLGYEFYQKDGDTALAMIIGAVIGGTIGAIIGFSIHFKTQRQYQEIIDQIEDLEDDGDR